MPWEEAVFTNLLYQSFPVVITLSGYSEEVTGYMISPKNYAVIKEPFEMKASVKNATYLRPIHVQDHRSIPQNPCK